MKVISVLCLFACLIGTVISSHGVLSDNVSVARRGMMKHKAKGPSRILDSFEDAITASSQEIVDVKVTCKVHVTFMSKINLKFLKLDVKKG